MVTIQIKIIQNNIYNNVLTSVTLRKYYVLSNQR